MIVSQTIAIVEADVVEAMQLAGAFLLWLLSRVNGLEPMSELPSTIRVHVGW